MSEQRCGQCGMIVADPTLGGLCPGCLLGYGLETEVVDSMAGDPIEQEGVAALFPELEILGLLGRGGMGVVYKARQREIDRVVALKLLDPELGKQEAFQERFAQEGRALARLDHPNIVRLLEYGERGEVFYLCLEFVDGSDLRGLLQIGQLEPRRVLSMVPQICDALGYAHDLGVVHRDIKPENILVDSTGRIRITDFGLARLAGDEESRSRLTAAGTRMGTPYYMAPEQVDAADAVDHRADIYSLGVVCYELLTGDLPLGRFEPPSSKAQVAAHVDEVVLKSLEKEPQRRFQHTSELKAAMAGKPIAPPDEGPEKGSRILMILGCVQWIATLLVLGWLHMEGGAESAEIWSDLGMDVPPLLLLIAKVQQPFVYEVIILSGVALLVWKERWMTLRHRFAINFVSAILPPLLLTMMVVAQLLLLMQLFESIP